MASDVTLTFLSGVLSTSAAALNLHGKPYEGLQISFVLEHWYLHAPLDNSVKLHIRLPPDTHPVIDNAAMALMVQEHAQALGRCRIHPLGALTVNLDGEQITEFATLAQAGCVGLSNAHRTIKNTLVLRRAFQYAHTFGLTVFINPQDPWLRGNGVMHEGETSTRLGLPAIPDAAETVDVARILSLIETTGARVHFSQLSSARSVDMISDARLDGLPVTADVAIHHLHLIDQDINLLNTHCHVLPPLRDQRDREGLRKGLSQGTLGAICSDHQPVGSDAKLTPFASSAPGISSLEHLLPLVLKLVEEGVIDLHTALSRLTIEPAQMLGIEDGRISTGTLADLCLFDMDAEWTLDPSGMVSGGQNTPFSGWPLRGRVTRTVISGESVFQL